VNAAPESKNCWSVFDLLRSSTATISCLAVNSTQCAGAGLWARGQDHGYGRGFLGSLITVWRDDIRDERWVILKERPAVLW